VSPPFGETHSGFTAAAARLVKLKAPRRSNG
jgi:hypothetical protein